MAELQSMLPQPPAREGSAVERADDNPSSLPPIIREAKDRFDYASRWENQARQYFLDDIKFANADCYNGYQWPDDIRRNRDVDERPCLTINKVRQHNLQIINDCKKNKPEIKIRPTGNGATAESAEAIQALMRHIEYRSNASTAYDLATSFQVTGGIGYIRIITAYVDEKSFDQEILIRRIVDPLTVYLDPAAKEADKSDMRFAFVFDDILRDEFDSMYPEYADTVTEQNVVDDEHGWVRKDYIRICEYFRKVEEDDTLLAYRDPQSGQTLTILESVLKAAPDLLTLVKADPRTRSRPVRVPTIKWHFIIGTKVVETRDWPGKYIPIVPVIGEEIVIEGLMDRKGHTRAMIDPQRMYNYWSSLAVEYGALQSKSPYIAPAEAIEGYESYWNTANKVNHSLLPFNGLSDDGTPIPPPQRQEPPVAAPVALTGMQIAAQEFMFVSGQYQNQMGEGGPERSAKAINERVRQGETSTFHFIDNQATAIRQVGRICLDLFPHIYDTPRLMQIQANDGMDFELEIDPRAQQLFAKKLDHQGKVIGKILNPTVGMYEVQADVGPSWGTKREETFNALALVLTQAPQLTSIIGDLLLASSDFDKANEAAARLRRMVPPQALGEGPSMQEQQLMAQVQQLSRLLEKTMGQLAQDKLRLRGHAEKRDVDVANAFTQRLKVLLDYKVKAGEAIAEADIDDLLKQAHDQASSTDISQIVRANTGEVQGEAGGNGNAVVPFAAPEAPPVPGAKRGADGHWYMRDMARSNAWARVM